MAIFQVVHKQRLLLQEVRNVFYYETITGDPTSAEWQDIADEIRVDLTGDINDDQSASWSFYAIEYRKVDVAGLLSVEVIPTAGTLVGVNANNEVPTQIALLVSVKGDTVKPNRARTYLAGFTIAGLTDSIWGSNIVAACELFVDLQSVLNAAGTNELQRVSAQWNSSHTQVIAFNNIAARPSKGSLVPATQRRRRIGVGI